MNISDELTKLESVYDEFNADCYDFLGLFRARLAVLYVHLSMAESMYDAMSDPLYLSNKDYLSTVNTLVCEEMARMLDSISEYMFGLERKGSHD